MKYSEEPNGKILFLACFSSRPPVPHSTQVLVLSFRHCQEDSKSMLFLPYCESWPQTSNSSGSVALASYRSSNHHNIIIKSLPMLYSLPTSILRPPISDLYSTYSLYSTLICTIVQWLTVVLLCCTVINLCQRCADLMAVGNNNEQICRNRQNKLTSSS